MSVCCEDAAENRHEVGGIRRCIISLSKSCAKFNDHRAKDSGSCLSVPGRRRKMFDPPKTHGS